MALIADPIIEIREPGLPIRRITVEHPMEVGRECDGEVLSDEGVSRRHLKLVPSPLGLSVIDLGSRNGTLLNGSPLQSRALLGPGDVLRLGRTEIVVARPAAARVVVAPARTVLASAVTRPVPAPPPVPSAVLEPTVGVRALRRVLRGAAATPENLSYRNYLEFPRRLPQSVWHLVRVASIAAYVALVAMMFLRPAGALFTFFKVIIPLLPILFFVAPGLWRNICPLAAANQAPRVLGFSKAATTPQWLQRRGYIIAIVLFFGIAGARLALFNTSARATGVLLAITIVSAFVAGSAFKGKSGWCSSICPLLPLQRVYGQTPFLIVANSHCSPCVACTKNCYDFKPEVAYQADLREPDPQWSGPRKLFASALPGFVLGFFTLVGKPGLSDAHIYERLVLYVIGSVGTFYAAEALLPLTVAVIVALYASAAINLFYWFEAVVLTSSFHTITGTAVTWAVWPIRVVVLLLTLIWISRTAWSERRYLVDTGVLPQLIPITVKERVAGGDSAAAASAAEVRLLPEGASLPAETGLSLLEVIEGSGTPIEAGCRMGVCGADPVAVLSGAECLSAPEEEELNTLRRLGLASSTRMACCARLSSGSVDVSLTPEPGDGTDSGSRPTRYDRSITSVVVLGNGIAGVTAADFVRRGHPDCEVHLVGEESHVLYNRMGISRLVYGRSAMAGLYLLAEQWYPDNGVNVWLNTIATQIDLDNRFVALGTGERLFFDRLILTTGSNSAAPSIAGFGAPGTFVMRSAEDAMRIRSFVQQNGSRSAVVAGSGLLGLEAAFALHELGLKVRVLERGSRLLARQIDERCSELVQAHFDRLGIVIEYGAESLTLSGTPRIDTLTLKDGRTLACDVFLAAVGIRPNVDLARAAGISVNRGILVDDRMQTSAPGVFAAGDVAEHNGLVLGLWPIAAKQAETAAVNALGGDDRLVAEIPATILKGVDLELASIGRVQPEAGDEIIVDEDASVPSYRRLIVSRGVLVGAIVLGHHPDDLTAATAAVKRRQLLEQSVLAELRFGNWRALKQSQPQPALATYV